MQGVLLTAEVSRTGTPPDDMTAPLENSKREPFGRPDIQFVEPRVDVRNAFARGPVDKEMPHSDTGSNQSCNQQRAKSFHNYPLTPLDYLARPNEVGHSTQRHLKASVRLWYSRDWIAADQDWGIEERALVEPTNGIVDFGLLEIEYYATGPYYYCRESPFVPGPHIKILDAWVAGYHTSIYWR
ncbi:hypothetical protein DL766_006449 [Monosporascus sp. MC13-8B]|nr:hypothetical protein DL763_010574 [Monosporascus cannonballus]RYP27339.1 hypothetical protein DL766_006449 [Monosporascus sp. MC13-8B]